MVGDTNILSRIHKRCPSTPDTTPETFRASRRFVAAERQRIPRWPHEYLGEPQGMARSASSLISSTMYHCSGSRRVFQCALILSFFIFSSQSSRPPEALANSLVVVHEKHLSTLGITHANTNKLPNTPCHVERMPHTTDVHESTYSPPQYWLPLHTIQTRTWIYVKHPFFLFSQKMRPILLTILLMSVAAYAATDMMRSMVIGQSEEAHHRQNRGTSVGTVCRPPGGIVNLDGECLCCGGWGGPGCATRNKCHEVSCANGGTCDPNTGFCQCPLAHTGHQCEVWKKKDTLDTPRLRRGVSHIV
jgi:hypothetical protein